MEVVVVCMTVTTRDPPDGHPSKGRDRPGTCRDIGVRVPVTSQTQQSGRTTQVLVLVLGLEAIRIVGLVGLDKVRVLFGDLLVKALFPIGPTTELTLQ